MFFLCTDCFIYPSLEITNYRMITRFLNRVLMYIARKVIVSLFDVLADFFSSVAVLCASVLLLQCCMLLFFSCGVVSSSFLAFFCLECSYCCRWVRNVSFSLLLLPTCCACNEKEFPDRIHFNYDMVKILGLLICKLRCFSIIYSFYNSNIYFRGPAICRPILKNNGTSMAINLVMTISI